MDALIKSYFNYCPLKWMFHDRRANSKLNKVFERALRIACNDGESNSVNKYCNMPNHLQLPKVRTTICRTEIIQFRGSSSWSSLTSSLKDSDTLQEF